ncbi:unnamed protein product [Cuscuta europaea]|uniref:Uncharacterized protein n=1 Tax=Cuscuta europaea TaxID=41803 RepID=A0A9P0ZT41_CUSEU|nr:unnamed protein product [Cuscuta europaea]
MASTNENDGASGSGKSATDMRGTRLQSVRKAKGKRSNESARNEFEQIIVKRQRKQGEEQESDDDFEVQPRHGGVDTELVENKAKKISIKEIKSGYRSIRTRSSPHVLAKALSGMTEAQKADVKSIGFGALFDLDIAEIPGKLGYWVLDSFDPKKCSLVLPDGTNVRITELDVTRVLGFPLGGKTIAQKKKNEDCAFLQDWRAIFNKEESKISPSDVSAAMLSKSEGDDWFKRHFIVLVVYLLLDNTQNGYVNPIIMNQLEDVDQIISELKWCDHVLNCLIENKVSWEKK